MSSLIISSICFSFRRVLHFRIIFRPVALVLPFSSRLSRIIFLLRFPFSFALTGPNRFYVCLMMHNCLLITNALKRIGNLFLDRCKPLCTGIHHRKLCLLPHIYCVIDCSCPRSMYYIPYSSSSHYHRSLRGLLSLLFMFLFFLFESFLLFMADLS
jgi:hypothetical protein